MLLIDLSICEKRFYFSLDKSLLMSVVALFK